MQTVAIQQQTRGSEPIIKVTNLTKKFVKGSNIAAIDHISFEVGREVVTLFGPSGCGKTTTLRCIAGLEKPDEGEIVIDGKVVTSIEKGIFVPPEKRNIGLVFQSYALWPHMKVYDNVAYGLRVRHTNKADMRSRVNKVLETVGLAGYEDRYPAQLSGGQQQRVALARSMVYEPKVLLLDEPLSNLDAKIRERTRIELKALLTKIGITSVYVTHDQEEAFLMSDKIVVMNEGKIMQQDTPYNVYHSPANQFVASFVGRSNLIPGMVVKKGSPAENGRDSNGVVRILGDYDIECTFPSSLAEGQKCLVMVRSNEVGLSSQKPAIGGYKECEVLAREYKGAMTDHLVKIGDETLMVSTHRFCDLNQAEIASPSGKHYVLIRGEAVSVVPEQ
ncbi:MAG TPA: ABC transporter ATP-binding protein [Nitrososphaerales archaeon]|nr:ABC transporter ATP-binding protein [Nitrososphaerales archaeon]